MPHTPSESGAALHLQGCPCCPASHCPTATGCSEFPPQHFIHSFSCSPSPPTRLLWKLPQDPDPCPTAVAAGSQNMSWTCPVREVTPMGMLTMSLCQLMLAPTRTSLGPWQAEQAVVAAAPTSPCHPTLKGHLLSPDMPAPGAF